MNTSLLSYGETNVNRSGAISSTSTSTITSQSADFNITVNKSNGGTTLDYDIKSILPTNADVQRLDISLYGNTGDFPTRFLSTSGNLLGRLVADPKYKNFELQVILDYTHNDRSFFVNERINVSSSRSVSLAITERLELYNSDSERIEILERRIAALETKINHLLNIK